MSAADGRLIGLETVRVVADDNRQFNIVLLADGYVEARIGQFAIDSERFVEHLLATPPFDQAKFGDCFNIYRIDVVSDESGADNPHCAQPGGTGRQARTYFDSTYCFDGQTQRLLYGNPDLAQQVASQFVPAWHQVMVLVDDPGYGGAGGTVAWFSRGSSDWLDVAIHEMGHSAFGLADEYDYDSGDHYTGGEPGKANLSIEPDPARVKWRALCDAGPAIPTWNKPDCHISDAGFPTVYPAQTGTFAGGGYYHCGIYRPSWDCKMRTVRARFCKVCTGEIERTLTPFT